MKYVIDILDLFIRSFVSIIYLFFLTKMMGARQINQLTFFDYVVGISIGSIAAQMATDQDLPYVNGLISMLTYAGVSLIITYLTIKSLRARRFFTGNPIILVDKGILLTENLKKAKYDVNDLLSDLREQGYFNVADIYYAIMETNGNVSVLPKSLKRPLTPEDLSQSPVQEEPLSNIIIDGKIIKENLIAIKKDYAWVYEELKKQNTQKREVLLATCDSNFNFSIYHKNQMKVKINKFD